MGVFLPSDLQERIGRFIAGKINFPFVQKEEVLAAFFLFGKDNGVDKSEIKTCHDLARKASEQLAKDIRLYQNAPNKMDSEFTRQNYTKRSMQIVVENQSNPLDVRPQEMGKRIAGDPAILSDCFAQHVAYYNKDFCFELFGPLAKGEMPPSLKSRLEGRMVLLSFNSSKPQFKRPLLPFFNWMTKSG